MTTIATDARPVTQTCPVCRFMYVPYFAEDRRLHRRWHDQWMRPRQPKPDPRFADNVDVIVDKTSPKWLHRLVYERAQALRRDQHYDFVQWREDHCPAPRKEEGRVLAILLIEDSAAVGVVSFEFVIWTDAPPGWHMCMAWVAEPWRRRGVLTRRWPRWLATYGAFTFEPRSARRWPASSPSAAALSGGSPHDR